MQPRVRGEPAIGAPLIAPACVPTSGPTGIFPGSQKTLPSFQANPRTLLRSGFVEMHGAPPREIALVRQTTSNLLTVAEAAGALRLSVPTVRRLIRNGRIAAVQIGGRHCAIRIPEDQLDELLTPEVAAEGPPTGTTHSSPRGPRPAWMQALCTD